MALCVQCFNLRQSSLSQYFYEETILFIGSIPFRVLEDLVVLNAIMPIFKPLFRGIQTYKEYV
jgi:hypothetical protein